MTDVELLPLAEQLAEALKFKQLSIATAESCTGGMLAQTLTALPGSSVWFDCGFVTYSNRAKMQMLGVKKQTLENYGAVSAETVTEMVQGVLHHSDADCAVSVSGIAGPVGGTAEKPVGTVFMAWQLRNQPYTKVWNEVFQGDRRSIREQSVFSMMLTAISELSNNASG